MKKIYLVIKRLFDILIGLIGFIILMPICLIIKIIFLINKDKYTIFYKHKRVGKNGKVFYMYKFRTMIPDADKQLNKLLRSKKRQKEWNRYRKLSNDPRITKVGKHLRKSSIDELPQILNVLKGDMSLIGPRPLIEGELDSYNGNHELYESIKPGITGWWACNGRSDVECEERLQLEYYYCNNYSLLLDIKCLFKTIIVVIKRIGAK